MMRRKNMNEFNFRNPAVIFIFAIDVVNLYKTLMITSPISNKQLNYL